MPTRATDTRMQPPWLAGLLLGATLSLSCNAQSTEPPLALTPPPEVTLDRQDRQDLANGERVYFFVSTTRGQLSGVAFRVQASEATVWRILRSFEDYDEWVKNVSQAAIYAPPKSTPGSADKDVTYVAFRAKHWLVGAFDYHVRHYFPWPQSQWGTFELDDTQHNDFAAAFGFWRVLPVPGESAACDIYYVAEIDGGADMSAFMQNRFIKGGLKSATHWVKEQTEKAQRRR